MFIRASNLIGRDKIKIINLLTAAELFIGVIKNIKVTRIWVQHNASVTK